MHTSTSIHFPFRIYHSLVCLTSQLSHAMALPTVSASESLSALAYKPESPEKSQQQARTKMRENQ